MSSWGGNGDGRSLEWQLERVARVDDPVHFHGRTGAGKEVAARRVHALSGRRGGPFVGFNCANLQPSLAEAQLLGAEKGSHSGADKIQPGLFDLAQGGSVLLDEIGELELALQAKLLRVLEERQYLRLGGRVPVKLDVRILSATVRDLWAMVQEGRFREDLYFRLVVLVVEVPALVDRPHELAEAARRMLADRGSGKSFSPCAVELLGSYRWPGSFRELRNVVARVDAYCEGPLVTASDLLAFAALHPAHLGAAATKDEPTCAPPPVRVVARGASVPAGVDASRWSAASNVERAVWREVASALAEADGNKCIRCTSPVLVGADAKTHPARRDGSSEVSAASPALRAAAGPSGCRGAA